MYRYTSDISGTLAGNKIVDHSDVVGAWPVDAAPTISSCSTSMNRAAQLQNETKNVEVFFWFGAAYTRGLVVSNYWLAIPLYCDDAIQLKHIIGPLWGNLLSSAES